MGLQLYHLLQHCERYFLEPSLGLTPSTQTRMVSGMRIGIVSDTHLPNLIRQLDELGPEPARFFSTVDLILHSGDLTSPMVLDWLERFAPVVCTTGNNDPIVDSRCLDVHVMEVYGWRLGMVHSLRRGFRPMAELQQLFPTPVDIMVAGDTHQERLEYREGVVLLNSGSATFPQHKDLRLGTVGLLELAPNRLHAEIILLGQTPGRPNPGQPRQLQIQEGQVVSESPIGLDMARSLQ
jgi:putative phosphoesterase